MSRRSVHRWIPVASLLVSGALASCLDEDPVNPPQLTVTSEATAADLIPADEILEDPFQLALALEMPEFGGFYYNEAGRLEVASTDASRSAVVRDGVRGVLPTEIVDGSIFEDRVVQYSFLTLARNRTLLERSVFTIPNVVSIGVKESINRIRVGVVTPTAAEEVLALAARLGIPRGMVTTTADAFPIQSMGVASPGRLLERCASYSSQHVNWRLPVRVPSPTRQRPNVHSGDYRDQ